MKNRLRTTVLAGAISLLVLVSFSQAQVAVEAVGEVVVHVPQSWSVVPSRYTNAYEIANVPADALETSGVARIMILTEQRLDHAGAVRRLKEIDAEQDTPATFLQIGGWPALQRRYILPIERPSANVDEAVSTEMSLRVTTAIAVGDRLIRIQGTLQPGDDPRLADGDGGHRA